LEEHDSIDIRSKAFQEVLGEPPSWLLRWGISAIFVAFIALFVVGYFLKYPETVTASIRLETSNPPLEVAAPSMGQISGFLPEDTIVKRNDVLAKISNNADDANSILKLGKILGEYGISNNTFPNLDTFERKDLGLVQTNLYEYLNIQRGNGTSSILLKGQTINIYNQNIDAIKKEIGELNKRILQKEVELKKIPEQREKYKVAFDGNYNEEYIKLQRQLLAEKDQLETDIKTLKGQINQKEREIINQELGKSDYQNSIQDTRATKIQRLEISLFSLKNKVEEWMMEHLVRAPIEGKLVYQGKLKSKEYLVGKGDKIFAIIPPGAKDTIEGKLYLDSDEAIKIKTNQKVKIKFSAYKPSEFGLLEGVVVNKATIPENGQYLVTINLPKRMKTSKDKLIPFQHQMQGEAEIITEDRRFTDLILKQFKEMLTR